MATAVFGVIVISLQLSGSQCHHHWLLRSSFCYMQRGWPSLIRKGMTMKALDRTPTCLATQRNAQSDVPKQDRSRIQPQCCSSPPKFMNVRVLLSAHAISHHWQWGHWCKKKKVEVCHCEIWLVAEGHCRLSAFCCSLFVCILKPRQCFFIRFGC